ncbi:MULTISPECIES: 2-hydroxyacid dehydrogenase [Rhizobium]|uniref:2-hydroxyacid dehydrogenase n=1 Tax=Rhizobium rhododendri TaxID=2506430 RepID=A0ABY8IFG9_9HYPH|nr:MULTISPECIES: 2-hydroxyacid dehydrogenase [Rhizobium]MBZ5759145.1 2-hydroxyacid dehydrogenase [Rhizobium sp. VS19-DR96]MBZ5764024.1 2-hydroxyacid dehydrogenase [Rhizobium sp. VS19-DR129.2]MBZ5771568.1 2-hydroxyacid dehydrogenase [Rhizobium sp. VS19-DRK62.2]MBZ5783745.1 2-hydroxyacid dehydrogenase [Rhizobium sp. VS19-DR121]MBZ5801581.1 2-hydroxyacid dehydrogenase [Rhizobium sp. VS19-DR181]
MPDTRPTVLVLSDVHPRVAEKLKERFDVLVVGRSQRLAIEPAVAERIHTVASSGTFESAWMDQLPNLQLIASFGVGYDGVDVAHAVARRVVVTNTPDVLNDEVADTTIGLLLNTLRQFPTAEQWLRQGNWKNGAYPLAPFSLTGRHVGIFGLGRIGKEIAHRLAPFKVKISYHTRTRYPDVEYDYYPTLREMAEAVDTLIAIVPKTAATHKVIDAEIMSALGPNGVLINVGRGWSVDEDALAAALGNGMLGAAGLDVFYNEPHVPEALLALPNATLLPHLGSATVQTRDAMADLVAGNIISWLENGHAVTPVPETPLKR